MFPNGIERVDQDTARADCRDRLRANASSPALRVALTLDPRSSLAWIARVAEVVNNSGRASVCLLIICNRSRQPQREALLFRAWRRVDRLLFRVETDEFLRGAPALSEVPQVILREQDFANGLSADAYEELQSANIDLIIDVGRDECWRELRWCSQYGIWRLPDSPSDVTDYGLFWQMYQNASVSKTTLEALPVAAQTAQIIDRSFAAVDVLSLARNRQTKERKACELLLHKLQTFSPTECSQSHRLMQHHRSETVHWASRPVPGNGDVAKFACKWIANAARHVVRSRIWKEHWFIAYRRNVGSLPHSESQMHDFQIVPSAKDRFYADPFCIDRGGNTYLFFEDYPFDKGKGFISYVEIDSSGKCTSPAVALKREYHLSYPHVFEHEGEIYMVPESMECGRVDLYRATDFPRHWVLEKTLIDNIAAVDPTIFCHDGKVWLFVSGVTSKECINEELFLFFSDSLFGAWTPHPCNPIVSDVRRARPAGRICVQNGDIIRPAQDCSHSYGRAITFHRIEALTESTYRETPIATIGPAWRTGNLGTHTFNQSNLVQTVDGRVWMRKYRSQPGWRALWNRRLVEEHAPCTAICEANVRREVCSTSIQKTDEMLIDGVQQKRYAAELTR